MQKSAFERTGLVPRSIIRTFDRFRRQLLPGAEDLVIQEFRVSKYQVLVSVRCLASLLFFPLLVNYLVKTTILIPLAEYIWNTQQNEIFLNFYQENRAFLEMRDFEEKTFFESLLSASPKENFYEALVSAEPRQSDYDTLMWHKIQNNFDLLPVKSSKMRTFHPVEKNYFTTNLDLSETFREKGILIKNKIDNFVNLSQTSKICKETPPLKNLTSQNDTKNYETKNCNNKNFNYTLNLKDSFLNLSKKRGSSEFLPTELKELNLNKIQLEKFNFLPKPKFYKVSSNSSALHFVKQNVQDPFSIENKKVENFPKIDEILLQKKFQEKTIQLATFYNQQTISAIANVFGDFVTLITIAFLFVLMKPQIIILKSFLTESIYSLSDTTKSFLLILLTDLLVGFHSPRGWEILIEILLRHFGLPENQDFVFLFVATLPVLLDTVFKYWIFRYLNQISPSTVATYHSMIE